MTRRSLQNVRMRNESKNIFRQRHFQLKYSLKNFFSLSPHSLKKRDIQMKSLHHLHVSSKQKRLQTSLRWKGLDRKETEKVVVPNSYYFPLSPHFNSNSLHVAMKRNARERERERERRPPMQVWAFAWLEKREREKRGKQAAILQTFYGDKFTSWRSVLFRGKDICARAPK